MDNALIFLFRTASDMYTLTFILRFIMQWISADARNPLSQFVLKVTNPLVIPARRVIPSIKGWDTATIIVIFTLELLASIVLLNVSCIGTPDVMTSVGLAILRSAYLVLNTYFFLTLAYVVLSWIGSGNYNPLAAMLASVVEPVLRVFRKFVPAIAGIDLSPLFAILAIQVLMRLLPFGYVLSNVVCTAPGQLL